MQSTGNPTGIGARHAVPLLTAFAASGAIMMIELTAGRLVSSHLGSSLYTWTSIIAVIMAGMSVGNALGGYVADRFAPRKALAALFFLAAVATVITQPINGFLGGFGALVSLSWPARIFCHTFGLFFVPAIALGAIVPVVARLALALGGPQGRTVGLVYAAGVLGSIICTFLTGYYLVFAVTVPTIFLVAAATLLGLGIVYGLWAFLGTDAAPEQRAEVAAHPGIDSFPWWTAILTVMASNFAFMALQLGAARVLSRDYGSSIYTWTATIGVFLAGITLGNMLGGWLADKSEPRRALSKYFLAGAVATLLGPFLFRLLHETFLHDPKFESVGWGTRIVLTLGAGFFLPCLFLGYISPLVVKRGLDAGRAPGRTVASVYAWGALGGVLGTLLTGYFLIDWFGSLTVVCAVAVILAAASVAYARPPHVHAVVLLAAVGVTFCAYSSLPFAVAIGDTLKVRPKQYDGVFYQDESQYSFIAVRTLEENPNVREIILDKLAHSEIDFDDPYAFKQEYEWVYDAVVEKFYPKPQAIRTFFIGGGGFIFPRYFDELRPGSHTEVTEIDPAVTKAAYEVFGLSPDNTLEIHNMDARNRITSLIEARRADAGAVPPYDIIIGDSFNDFSVPAHLTTQEFTQSVNELLAEDGLYLLNMIDMHDPGMFLSAFVNTLQTVFPHVYVFNCGAPPNVRDTYVIVASKIARDLRDIPAKVAEKHPYGGKLYSAAATDALFARTGRLLLTDDYAPTELLLMPVVRRPVRFDGQDHYTIARQVLLEGLKERALAEARLAVKYHPTWPDAQELIGDLLAEQKQVDGAVEAYRAGLRDSLEPGALRYKIAQVYFEADRVAEGAVEIEAVVKDEPDNVDALLRLAALRLEQQRVDEAITMMQHALEVDPNNVDGRYNLGFAYASMQRYPEAIAQWEAGLAINPAHVDSLRNLLLAHILSKDFAKAHEVVGRYGALGQPAPADLLQQLIDAENGVTPGDPHADPHANPHADPHANPHAVPQGLGPLLP